MRRLLAGLSFLCAGAISVAGEQGAPSKAGGDPGLKIFFIDVEGGASTLVVTPAGEGLLLDSGSAGGRDAARIAKVARDEARLARIDHYVITHWHDDHYGGTKELSELIPIDRFYDHGPSVETENFDEKFGWYIALSKGKRSILKPGDAVPLKSSPAGGALEVRCLASAGKTLPGRSAGSPGCKSHERRPVDMSDNALSITVLLSFGAFRFLDCGDLTWNIEHELACPENRVGPVDLFQVTHHGLALSNNPALVWAIEPRVAIINNGTRKGAEAEVLGTLRKSPGLQAFYQLHRRMGVAAALQAPSERIANEEEACQGSFIRVEVDAAGTRYKVGIDAHGAATSFDCKGKSVSK